MSAIIIAEAGVNHNGSLDEAKRLIQVAATSGCDYVKFQSFRPSSLTTQSAPKAEYQVASHSDDLRRESQFEMLDKLCLTDDDELILLEHCKNIGIKFLSTAFDRENLERLVSLGVDFVKIPSGEITNLPYLKFVSTLDLPVLLSTGMSTMQEVANALGVLRNSRSNVRDVTVMQCTSAYPAALSTVNLRVLAEFERLFDVKIGFSDHTIGSTAAMAATALGASVIEKHFTMDKFAEGPDHSASLNPGELLEFVRCIREVEVTLGTSIKQPQVDEIANIVPIRRSIVASRRIEKGELFSEQNLTCKRPSSGISPMKWENVIGVPAKRLFQADEMIEL